jgi:hypothetical protein
MSESNVVQFPGTIPAEPAPEPVPPPTNWWVGFLETDYANLCYLIDRLGGADGEEEVRQRMSDIRSAVSTWPI